MSALHRLARAAGLSIDWKDANGRRQRVSDDTLTAVLDALGLPATSDPAISNSRRRLQEQVDSALITADAGEPFTLPDGSERTIREPGYHEVEGVTVAVAPSRGHTVADAAGGRRIWGPAVQITSLRDRRDEPFGDFGALARFVEASGAAGADAVAISPVHALFPGDPSSFSPYGPSTRLFLNLLLGDPAILGDQGGGGAGGELIDWSTAIPERMRRLRALYQARTDETRGAVDRFAREQGEALRRHACFDALFARFRTGSQAWPPEYRDCRSEAVARFAEEQAEEVGFYLFLQWLADASLARAQEAAKRGGMAVGLIADMAVGMSAGGSQAWSRPEGLLSGLSVGAPPDLLGPEGQDWGITTFSPLGLRQTGYRDFIDTIRAALRHAGGIRIDHAMSLRRLWVVPHGAPATEGAYLAYPQQDLMRLLALESWRAKAIVVGEDLGTVPPGFREAMQERGFLGMRVLWFERSRGGGFLAPDRYDAHAAAMTSTHDLPTIAGWWSGRDIAWNRKIGRIAHDAAEADQRAERETDKKKLWQACRNAGAAEGRMPAEAGPAVNAATRFIASTPSDLAIIPVEDLLGLDEQPNLPGTIDEHPNWRRRLPGHAEDMLDAVRARIDCIDAARRS